MIWLDNLGAGSFDSMAERVGFLPVYLCYYIDGIAGAGPVSRFTLMTVISLVMNGH